MALSAAPPIRNSSWVTSLSSEQRRPVHYLRPAGIAIRVDASTDAGARNRRTTTTTRRELRVEVSSISPSGTITFSMAINTKWSLQLTAINITNKYALYNFLSTFSGTHYVTPRALTAELGFHF